MTRPLFDPDRVAGPPPEPAARPRPLTVSALSALIRDTLEAVPGPLRVVGEVSNLSRRNHWYFSLKDEQSVLSCVAWASSVREFSFVPEEGSAIVATGHLSYYGPQGRTQLYVRRIEAVGAGALEARFRAMCDELRALGYFDEAIKKPLPVFPRRIAVITSAGGAAIHDVMDTAARRCRAVELVHFDVRVQGDGAAGQIAAAIRRADEQAAALGLDAILVTRGGGSVEDLWAFNERVVADAARQCRLPLVAAIGHESDTTVIELVADVRAATPTQAVMRLIPDEAELRRQLEHFDHRLRSLLRRRIDLETQRVERAARAPLLRAPRELVRLAAEALQSRRTALVRALRARADQRDAVAQRGRRLSSAVASLARSRRNALDAVGRRLDAVDPHGVLRRGYSYTTTADGRLVAATADVRPGDAILTRVSDGAIRSVVDGEGVPASQMELFEAGG